jgi:hypothetical protein
MSQKSLTFQKCLPRCEEGDPEAWQILLRNYAPIAQRLMDFYLPQFRGDAQKQLWKEALGVLAANRYERLRAFDHLSEREFLIDLRAFLLDFGATRLKASGGPSGVPRPTPESLAALLHGLPLAHQEIVFLKLAGHSDTSSEKVSGVPPSIARKALENLESHYAPILRPGEDSCPWPAAWLELLRQARASRTPECVARRFLVRILDGQASWYEKSPAEAHLACCLHCLETWIALREVHRLRSEAKDLPPADVDEMLSCLPITAPARRGSFLRRLFGS